MRDLRNVKTIMLSRNDTRLGFLSAIVSTFVTIVIALYRVALRWGRH